MNSRRSSLMFVVAVVLCVAFLAGIAAASGADLPKRLDRVNKATRGSLDEDYTELRYLKTTDYGQTWTTFQQAGNVGTFSPSTSQLPDFTAVVTNGNELCYVVTCNDAENPGVYSFTGPTYDPVLIMATGSISWSTGFTGRGHTDIGKLPNGDLIAIMWGLDNGTTNTFWAAKSTNNGASWSTWVIATEPTLPPGSGADADLNLFPHISKMNASDFFFVMFQKTGTSGYDQYVMRVSTAGGAVGTVVSLNSYSGTYVSYYGGNCQPIAFDPNYSTGGAQGALFACFRSSDLSGTSVYYSFDKGLTFSSQSVPGAQRYPNMTVNPATSTPWVFSNGGVPGGPGEHCAWHAYDEFGYGGNAWSDRINFACTPFDGGDFWLMYMNEGYWWDADRGVACLNLWGNFTPDGINATYTADGGETWAEDVAIYHYETDGIDAGTVLNAALVGGTGGVAYIVTCGMAGLTDVTAPTVSGQTLDPSTPPDQPGPWVVKAYIDDNIQVDGPDWVRLDYMYNPLDEGEYYGLWGSEGGGADSCQGCDGNERLAGWYYFTLPTQHADGYTWQNGDTVWFMVNATDPPGNQTFGPEQAIVVGSEFLGVSDPVTSASDFRLLGNYPNPFNPSTYIQFQIPADLRVTMKVYNTLGQEVASLLDNHMLARGLHRVSFDGSTLASGVYIYTLEAGSFTASAKMVLLK